MPLVPSLNGRRDKTRVAAAISKHEHSTNEEHAIGRVSRQFSPIGSKCFFVRVFDLTRAYEKAAYKQYLRTVGEHFYYYEELTMAEIGVVLDLSESRVSQIHKDVLARLRNRFRGRLEEELVA